MSGRISKKTKQLKNGAVRNSLTIGQKLEIIRLIEKEGRSQIAVAREKGLRLQTVQQIYSQRVKITENFSKFNLASKKSKTSTFTEIDDALTKWFDAARAQNLPLTGPVMQMKAKEIAEQKGIQGFQGS